MGSEGCAGRWAFCLGLGNLAVTWRHPVSLKGPEPGARQPAGTVLAFKEAVRTAAGICGGRLVASAAQVVPE